MLLRFVFLTRLRAAIVFVHDAPSILAPQRLEDRRDKIRNGILCGLLISRGAKFGRWIAGLWSILAPVQAGDTAEVRRPQR